jgi:hypothetical protein
MSITNAGWWIAVSLLAVPAVAQTNLGIEKERGLGQALLADILRNGQRLPDAAVTGYVNRLGKRLLDQIPTPRHHYVFDVIATSKVVEPTALPDGTVVVPAAFLASVAGEAALARSLAHAVAHLESPLPHPRSSGNTIVWFEPYCHHDCPNALVIPLGMKPWRAASEKQADAFADALQRRTDFPADPQAFATMQQAVRDTLPPAPSKPSLYRRPAP